MAIKELVGMQITEQYFIGLKNFPDLKNWLVKISSMSILIKFNKCMTLFHEKKINKLTDVFIMADIHLHKVDFYAMQLTWRKNNNKKILSMILKTLP